jgi:hypothetical protein
VNLAGFKLIPKSIGLHTHHLQNTGNMKILMMPFKIASNFQLAKNKSNKYTKNAIENVKYDREALKKTKTSRRLKYVIL